VINLLYLKPLDLFVRSARGDLCVSNMSSSSTSSAIRSGASRGFTACVIKLLPDKSVEPPDDFRAQLSFVGDSTVGVYVGV
jgi:hypothetical protein